MRNLIVVGLAFFPGIASAQTVHPGRWDITSTVVDITVPGAPGFLLRMIRGRSRTEHKCVPAAQGITMLLAPDPKARCSVSSERIADGRYSQLLSCPQKRGEPLSIDRAGTYDSNGFTGRATMTGRSPKGTLDVVLNQRAIAVTGKCPG